MCDDKSAAASRYAPAYTKPDGTFDTEAHWKSRIETIKDLSIGEHRLKSDVVIVRERHFIHFYNAAGMAVLTINETEFNAICEPVLAPRNKRTAEESMEGKPDAKRLRT